MKAPRDTFRDEALTAALEQALASGRPESRAPLYDRLRRASGLPGVRLNVGIVQAFAAECARRGAEMDKLIAAMLALHEDVAPYGHVDEIFPILGVAGAGARAAADEKVRRPFLETLEEAACERTRFRIRDMVATMLVQIGVAAGPSFAEVLLRWASDDQPFLALAVAQAMYEDELLAALGSEGVCAVVDALLGRVDREHRAGRRHDAFRRLCRVMEKTPSIAAVRYPAVAVVLDKWAAREDEDVREILGLTVEKLRKGRAQPLAQPLADALVKSTKPLRDPRHGRLPGKRGRGKH